MSVFIISFVLICVIFAGMSIGVLMGRGPVKGSCGGMSALGLDTECDICGGSPAKCDNTENGQASAKVTRAVAYDAMSESARRS